MRSKLGGIRLCMVAGAMAAIGTGCETSPLQRDDSDELRERIVHANRAQLRSISEAPEISVTPPPPDSYLDAQPQRLELLDELSGPDQLKRTPLDVGPGLDDQESATATLTLRQALQRAARYNLDVSVAQLGPAITEAELVAAEAVFDAVLFADTNFSRINQPQTVPIIDGAPVGRPAQRSDQASIQTGIRQPLEAGGEISLSTGFDYARNRTEDLIVEPDPAFTSNIRLNVVQPLLRNFGGQINRAQIRITRNALRREALNLHGQLLTTIAETESAYWRLVFERHRLAVQQRLLERTIETRDRLEQRGILDAGPIQMAQAQATLEQVRDAVVRARQGVREASDDLKRLMNDPSLPLSHETLVVPADEPIQIPVEFSLLDTVTTALQRRPEMRQALLSIDDASIRQSVAENQRLPQLNLNAGVQFAGLDEDPARSYGRLGEADFVDYLVGLQFEMPIGNRGPEAQVRRTRLERQLSVAQYRQATQQIVASAKSALRELRTSYESIGHNTSARRFYMEHVRALLEREERGEALTPEFLNLKLQAQQNLANAELRELETIISYNIAIVRVQQVMGTLLEHNQIDMLWPEHMFAVDNNSR